MDSPGRILLLSIFFSLFFLSCLSYSFDLSSGSLYVLYFNITKDTDYWSGLAVNLSSTPFSSNPMKNVSVDVSRIYYTTIPNVGYGVPLVLTRLNTTPDVSNILSPVSSDFDEGGPFSNFSVFAGLSWIAIPENPKKTFCDPCVFSPCSIGGLSFNCVKLDLKENFTMYVLMYQNGSHKEPLFMAETGSNIGYNGNRYDLEYLVPGGERYYFYLLEECFITVYIDGISSDTFSRTANPYEVVIEVRDKNGNPIENENVWIYESNGRTILHPVLDEGLSISSSAFGKTNSEGRVGFVISPSEYNIPSSVNYSLYVLALGPSSCKRYLTVSDTSTLYPIHRSVLFNSTYENMIKASVQNMKQLVSTAAEWISEKKYNEINITFFTNGSYDTTSQFLRVGAPNLLNISVVNSTSLSLINASIKIEETDGHVVVIPRQPDKELFNSSISGYNTSSAIIVFPTEYNVNSTFKIYISKNDTLMGVVELGYNNTLIKPDSTFPDLSQEFVSEVSGSLQNTNMILNNIAESISTLG